MNWATIGAAVGSAAVSSAIGGKQTGAAAPAPQIGGAGNQLTGLMQQQVPDINQGAIEAFNSQPGGLLNIASLVNSADDSDIGGAGPVMTDQGVSESFRQGSTPQESTSGFDKLLGGVDGFLGGVDEGLQSPAQLLGLGLLGQLGDRRLPLAGLLAMGLFNQRKP